MMMRCALAALLVPCIAVEDGEKPTLFWMHVPKTGSFFAQTIRRVACPSYYQALRNGSAPPGPEPELRDWPKTCASRGVRARGARLRGVPPRLSLIHI